MAAGVDRHSMYLDSYNHGNLSNGALSWDGSYFQTGIALRYYAYAKVGFQCQGDNTWRNLLVGNDFKGVLEFQGSDASSSDYARYQFRMTSPAYGVTSWSQENYIEGGWNTGNFALQLATSGSSHVIQFKYSSYYSSNNTGSFQMIVRSLN